MKAMTSMIIIFTLVLFAVILPADAYCFSGIYLLKGKLAG